MVALAGSTLRESSENGQWDPKGQFWSVQSVFLYCLPRSGAASGLHKSLPKWPFFWP